MGAESSHEGMGQPPHEGAPWGVLEGVSIGRVQGLTGLIARGGGLEEDFGSGSRDELTGLPRAGPRWRARRGGAGLLRAGLWARARVGLGESNAWAGAWEGSCRRARRLGSGRAGGLRLRTQRSGELGACGRTGARPGRRVSPWRSVAEPGEIKTLNGGRFLRGAYQTSGRAPSKKAEGGRQADRELSREEAASRSAARLARLIEPPAQLRQRLFYLLNQ